MASAFSIRVRDKSSDMRVATSFLRGYVTDADGTLSGTLETARSVAAGEDLHYEDYDVKPKR
jgi:hypothetical protein